MGKRGARREAAHRSSDERRTPRSAAPDGRWLQVLCGDLPRRAAVNAAGARLS